MTQVRIELFQRPTKRGTWALITRKLDDGKVQIMAKSGEWVDNNPLLSAEEHYIPFGEPKL